MIVNKSMYPLQTGFSVISRMQDRMSTLQMQLGTGMKSPTLAGMGRDLPLSLSVRSRLDRIEGFSANVDSVNLRLSFLDNTMARFDKIEAEGRTSAMPGQYGTGNINMATLPDLSKARFDEVVQLLNSDVAGRYLFGGSRTDGQPLPGTDTLLEGAPGQAGFKAVVSERRAADAGDGMGRVGTNFDTATNTVSVTEDGVHPFGMKVNRIYTSNTNGALGFTQPDPAAGVAGSVGVTFQGPPAGQMQPGHTISIALELPDGTQTELVMKAVAAEDATGAVDEFVIGPDTATTAANFAGKLDGAIKAVASTELAGASTYAAAQNFFNSPGEPVLRVVGNPGLDTATELRVATGADTVMWYRGESPAITEAGLGRLGIGVVDDSVTLSEKAPVSAAHGFQLTGVSLPTANITTALSAGDPSSITVDFGAVPAPGETVTMTLTQPDGTTREIALTAVVGKAGIGQFTIGGDADATAANFSTALNGAISNVARIAEGNPRQSVSAQVDDSTRASYGLQANESGFLAMMRTLGAMAVETYPDDDASAKGRFDAMASRQQTQLSEGRNRERGSIEIITMELGIARSTTGNAATRHTSYKSQLDNLLSEVETVSKEDVAMEILALQTRLQASYQVTSMVGQLSLANYM